MSRLLLVSLLLALVGCSGGTIDSGATRDTRVKLGTSKDTPRGGAPTNPASPKSNPKDTPETAAPRTPERLQDLTTDLRDGDEARRVRAAKELRQWGKDAAPAAPALAAVIASAGGESRQTALDALEAIYPDLASDLHALVADEDPAKRIAAEKHLTGLTAGAGKPHPAAPFVPIIDWRIASLPTEAAKPKVGYDLAGEEYVALVPLMDKAGIDAAGFKAIVACASVSPEGGKALWQPAQLTLCEFAKSEIRGKEALAALDSSLSSRPSVVTLEAVGALGQRAKSLAPLLETLTTDRDANVRKAAAEALKKVQG
jgi:hypothetical protein